jgi:hypothetical protein
VRARCVRGRWKKAWRDRLQLSACRRKCARAMRLQVLRAPDFAQDMSLRAEAPDSATCGSLVLGAALTDGELRLTFECVSVCRAYECIP